MNFNENIKNDRKSLKSINKLNLSRNYHCDTLIEPIIPYDKFIDIMGQNDNYLICIFMNINRKCRKSRKNEG